jgi:dipeptidyl aminopeptidase/acylaminoacyl peptidase
MLAFLAISACAVLAAEGFKPLRGPYMGQEADGMPRIFLPGKISSGHDEGCSVFMPEARSFLWRVRRGDRSLLLLLEDKDGRWQPPEEQSLLNGDAGIWDFTLSPDGELVYFTSDAPVEGAGRANLWRVRRESEGWGTPEPLGPGVNTDANESHPSVSGDGTLYFFRRDPDDRSVANIYTASPKGGGFKTARKLGAPINSDHLDYDPLISADSRRLIFCSRRPGGHGEGDIYVSFRSEDGSWGEPRNLGPEVNSSAEENRPSVTLDGRYFFFTSNRVAEVELPPGVPPARSMPGNGSRDIYWMNADFLKALRASGGRR